jgi:ferritin-like metal-binding protein YciE
VSNLFAEELEAMLELERRLAEEVLPELRERAHAVDLRADLDRHLLETQSHVANLKSVRALAVHADALEGEDFAILLDVLRTEALEVAAYRFLVHAANALGLDEEAVRLLRLNMEQDAYALEQAEHALAKVLAEKIEN